MRQGYASDRNLPCGTGERLTVVALLDQVLRAIAVAFLVAGCQLLQAAGVMVVGEGPIVTQTREVTDFSQVEFNGGVKYELTLGQQASLTLTAQQNLLDITTSTVTNGKLTVTTTRPYTGDQGITVSVTAPSLTSIVVNGGVSGDVQAISATAFAIDANGGATLTVFGTCTALTFNGNGGSHVDATNLAATNATVSINGGASATLNVTGSVTGTANGGASLTLVGHPTSVSVNTGGGASVHQ
jgi:putative autotransporter adhesin-like protein